MSTAARRPPPARAEFCWFRALPTRWMDNDQYGHVNNVIYCSFIDTVVAHFLLGEGGLDPAADAVVGLAVESGCRFHRSLAFPDTVHAGLRVGHLGRSSVRYEVGIFRNDDATASADGHFVHVFVERASQRPAPIPERIRAALRTIAIG